MADNSNNSLFYYTYRDYSLVHFVLYYAVHFNDITKRRIVSVTLKHMYSSIIVHHFKTLSSFLNIDTKYIPILTGMHR